LDNPNIVNYTVHTSLNFLKFKRDGEIFSKINCCRSFKAYQAAALCSSDTGSPFCYRSGRIDVGGSPMLIGILSTSYKTQELCAGSFG
jgi:hypothetical protein